jgi:hypothetical protein
VPSNVRIIGRLLTLLLLLLLLPGPRRILIHDRNSDAAT